MGGFAKLLAIIAYLTHFTNEEVGPSGVRTAELEAGSGTEPRCFDLIECAFPIQHTIVDLMDF